MISSSQWPLAISWALQRCIQIQEMASIQDSLTEIAQLIDNYSLLVVDELGTKHKLRSVWHKRGTEFSPLQVTVHSKNYDILASTNVKRCISSLWVGKLFTNVPSSVLRLPETCQRVLKYKNLVALLSGKLNWQDIYDGKPIWFRLNEIWFA